MGRLAISEVLARPAPEAWRGFLREWYGIDGSGGIPPRVGMPRALRDFYEFAQSATRVFAINRLLAPDDIRTDAGHLVFYVEEQAAWLPYADAESALSTLRRLDLPPWHWPGSPARWYASEDAVGFTCPNITPGEDARGRPLSVWISAVSREAISFIEPHLSDAWDYYSARDG